MTPEAIGLIVGVVISLLIELAVYKNWKFGDWFNSLADSRQKLLTLGVGLLVVVVAFGLGCFNLLVPYWACSGLGAYDAFLVFLAYVLANQTTYALFLKKEN